MGDLTWIDIICLIFILIILMIFFYDFYSNNRNNVDKLVFENSTTELKYIPQNINTSLELYFNDIEIGGLNEENKNKLKKFYYIRKMTNDIKVKLNVKESKGILLYGKPGIGKSKIAREIIKLFNCKTVKFVSGPELVNKYFGESEKNIRNLFKDAKNDKNPENIHAIVMDEFDSLARIRTGNDSESSLLNNNIVNQLLSELDGLTKCGKVLFICTTNDINLIDPAVIRPGRIDTIIEINMPDKNGREEIFNIYLNKIDKQYISDEINVSKLAEMGEFSGAEIEYIVENTKTSLIFNSDNFSDILITQESLEQTVLEFLNNQNKKLQNEMPSKIDIVEYLQKLI